MNSSSVAPRLALILTAGGLLISCAGTPDTPAPHLMVPPGYAQPGWQRPPQRPGGYGAIPRALPGYAPVYPADQSVTGAPPQWARQPPGYQPVAAYPYSRSAPPPQYAGYFPAPLQPAPRAVYPQSAVAAAEPPPVPVPAPPVPAKPESTPERGPTWWPGYYQHPLYQ